MSSENPSAAHLTEKKKHLIDLHVLPSVRSGYTTINLNLWVKKQNSPTLHTTSIISHNDIMFFTMLEYESVYV